MSDFSAALSSFSTSLSAPKKKRKRAPPPPHAGLLKELRALLTPAPPTSCEHHLCFAFICLDGLPHLPLWLPYLRHLASLLPVTVIIHFKTPPPAADPHLPFYKKHSLPYTRSPSWGSPALAAVSLDLLRLASSSPPPTSSAVPPPTPPPRP